MHEIGISVEQPYCKILDFLRLTLPWTHPILNPVFYSFIGTWIHCIDRRTFRLSQTIDVLGYLNLCKGRQFRQNLLKYKNQRVSTCLNLTTGWLVPNVVF